VHDKSAELYEKEVKTRKDVLLSIGEELCGNLYFVSTFIEL